MLGLDIKQAKVIQDLIKDRLNPQEFLKLTHTNDEIPPDIEILSAEIFKNNNPDSYSHERLHERAWNKNGVKVKYAKKKDTRQFLTATQNLNEVAKEFTKDELVNMLKEAYYATYEHGLREKIYGDLLVYEILNDNIEDELLDSTEKEIKAWISTKYPDLKD